jgi:hypothetical protein
MIMIKYAAIISLLFCCCIHTSAQKKITDSSSKRTVVKKDTLVKRHSAAIATRRSALIPGWGQAYNKEYWKIPIVYGALAIPAATFFYNNTWYSRTKFAYDAEYRASINPADTADLPKINPKLVGLSLGSLQTYRNEFRKDRDYSVLWFLILWGLNVADATVFANLKDFDVSDDLSMHVNPRYDPITKTGNLGLTLNFKKSQHKVISVR